MVALAMGVSNVLVWQCIRFRFMRLLFTSDAHVRASLGAQRTLFLSGRSVACEYACGYVWKITADICCEADCSREACVQDAVTSLGTLQRNVLRAVHAATCEACLPQLAYLQNVIASDEPTAWPW